MNETALDPLEIEVYVDGHIKKIIVNLNQDPDIPGIMFETSFRHESGSHTDIIAGGGINMESLLEDIERKIKKYFEYDSPSFRIVHKK